MRGLEQIPWLYDLGLSLAERGLVGRWRRWLAGGARGRTLDLGTGTGRNLPLAPGGVRILALDPHPQNLARARRRGPGVPMVRARAEALPFRDGAFDTVLCALVLCSVEDPPRALAELRRVLRPGGDLRAMEHVRPAGLAGRIHDLLQPAWTRLTGGCHPNRDTERTIAEAGFELVPASREARGNLRRLEARAPLSRGPDSR
ncbi:Methyltransferase type 11 [Anaeromyxobacter sp. K]|uniref:class I SAM-dependent methyltransferase n=1 Tax=Anaeromyxobacter sp. (strain K) TaxID=447217 RepID=UPI00015F89C1|nr:class I SAM-dependent methyltransferase [Anaeromyxobacter sp. K]ACG73209.1 Methyltransferase type 11 [Anaeromyxobacter sp. K]